MAARQASLRLRNLPGVRVFRATVVSDEPQGLPSLPGTALHGALSDELAKRGSDLLEPPDRRLPGLGVTGQPPAPLALAPERFEKGQRPLVLEPGEPLAFRVAVIGERAGGRTDELLDTLVTAFARGLGVELGRPAERPRPPLRLVRWDEEIVPKFDLREPAPGTCRMQLLTPLRLSAGGRITSAPDGAVLRNGLVRRADALAQLYGGGALFPEVSAMALPALDLVDALLRVVDVGRYSSRQGRRMIWPGLIGELVLSGAGLAPLWPLLRFCEQVQLGKGTCFGFGWFRLVPLESVRSL